ncbi:hypothetical protein K493DRAFT_97263 [Basidiobolus meristosporus CBS 931.73]|uniref:Pleckstrin homology domain-containing protein n=1 Tax=Basidiobolus meristosporus CBS 931.73 TaxID=1314790 RepID=A0A1Y1X4D7_9FUNG|nr:hypothetical protein K493DRAFT_97263 [Basidiobolus meristosporus CBS 931.73]|eukprot:ORX80669.1 hypothetical protein K493DRAFT_97263 [Basidiobolus meristosporus CBS 931.73]
MLKSDPPLIYLNSDGSQEFSDSEVEFSDSDHSFEAKLREPQRKKENQSQTPTHSSVRRLRSFSASKLASPVRLTTDARLSELEAKLAEKENEVLLAADIGQVLLKEIDSLKYRLAAYEHSRPADDLSQEIEINNAETLQMLRSFRIEAEIYTSSFKEKSSKLTESPYSPGRRGEQSGAHSPFSLDSELDRAALPPPVLQSKQSTTSTLYTEINKAVESGENLMKLARQIQAKLLDAERESLNLAEKCSEQDRQMVALKMHITRGVENEAKAQENSWNLELQNQELQTQVAAFEQVVQKLTNDQGRLQEALLDARDAIEQLNIKDERSSQMIKRLKNRNELEVIGLRRQIDDLQREKAELNRNNEELNRNPSMKGEKSEVRLMGSPSPTFPIGSTSSEIDTATDFSDVPESTPQSPLPSSLIAGQTLQVETLSGSLGHAHRTIANLRSLLQKEKNEKLELKKILAETQQSVEDLMNESVCENANADKETDPFTKPDRKGVDRRSRQSIIRRSSNLHDYPPSSVNDIEERFIDRLNNASRSSILIDTEGLDCARTDLNCIETESDQSIDSRRSSYQWTPTRNPLIRRSTLNPMPIRDLLKELTLFDKLPKMEDFPIAEKRDLIGEGLKRKDQGIQASFATSSDICSVCGSSADPTTRVEQKTEARGNAETQKMGVPAEIEAGSSAEIDAIDKTAPVLASGQLGEGISATEVDRPSPEDPCAASKELGAVLSTVNSSIHNTDGFAPGLNGAAYSGDAEHETIDINSGAIKHKDDASATIDKRTSISRPEVVENNGADGSVQHARFLPVQWPKCDASTQTTNTLSGSSTPTRPATQPPRALVALSLSPIRLDRSLLKTDDRDKSVEDGEHHSPPVGHKRPLIPATLLSGTASASEVYQAKEKSHTDPENSGAYLRVETPSQRQGAKVIAIHTSTSGINTAHQSPRTAPTSPTRSDTLTSITTDSSFVEENWLSRRRVFSADPTIIHAITQAMIGDFMWKYTRRVLGTGTSEKKHLRYFWIHPYAKTINWGRKQPGPDRITHTVGKTFKSAYIESIRVVEDIPSSEEAPAEYSLVIQTTTRKLKIKALGKDKHDLWLLALTYLTSRDSALTSTPHQSGSASTVNEASRESPGKSPKDSASTVQSSLAASSRSISKKHSLARLFKKPSKSSLSSVVNLEKGDDNVEDVRKCCNGRHDVAKLEKNDPFS